MTGYQSKKDMAQDKLDAAPNGFYTIKLPEQSDMNEIKLYNVGGVWNTHPHWPSLVWGTGIDAAVKRLELIAEDYTFTFRTVEQRWEYNKPYGP